MARDDDLDVTVDTGNGFDRNQAATRAYILKKSVIEIRDLKEITAKVIKMQGNTTKTIDRMIAVVKSLDVKNEKLQTRVFWLSVFTGILALAQLLVAILP